MWITKNTLVFIKRNYFIIGALIIKNNEKCESRVDIDILQSLVIIFCTSTFQCIFSGGEGANKFQIAYFNP